MNSFQIQQPQLKLEQLRQQSKLHSTLEPIRKQHLGKLYSAIRTMLEELKTLTIGSPETVQKARV